MDARKAVRPFPQSRRNARPSGQPHERRRAADAHGRSYADGQSAAGAARRAIGRGRAADRRANGGDHRRTEEAAAVDFAVRAEPALCTPGRRPGLRAGEGTDRLARPDGPARCQSGRAADLFDRLVKWFAKSAIAAGYDRSKPLGGRPNPRHSHRVILGGKRQMREKLQVVAAKAEPVREDRYVLEEQVGFLLRLAMQRHTAIFTARMIEGLTQTQFAALAKLYEVGPCSQNHLGRLIYLDAATIKGVVDRLGLRGFVTALNDPIDRRRRAVTLTLRGPEVTEKAMQAAAQISAATLTPLTEDERRLLARLLEKLS